MGRGLPQQVRPVLAAPARSVGEPKKNQPEAWMWYRTTSATTHCPVVDTWWQTETGGLLISRCRGFTATKPAPRCAPARDHREVVDNDGTPVGNGEAATWSSPNPGPACLRGIWGDPDRYRTPTGPGSTGSTFPATAPRRTRTATCGCTPVDDGIEPSPATGSPPPRSNTPWSPTPRSPKPPSSVPPTPPLARRSSRSLRSRATSPPRSVTTRRRGEALIQELRNHVATQIARSPTPAISLPDCPRPAPAKSCAPLRDVADTGTSATSPPSSTHRRHASANGWRSHPQRISRRYGLSALRATHHAA